MRDAFPLGSTTNSTPRVHYHVLDPDGWDLQIS